MLLAYIILWIKNTSLGNLEISLKEFWIFILQIMYFNLQWNGQLTTGLSALGRSQVSQLGLRDHHASGHTRMPESLIQYSARLQLFEHQLKYIGNEL